MLNFKWRFDEDEPESVGQCLHDVPTLVLEDCVVCAMPVEADNDW